ncbi:MAG: stage 0 sporulation family protein [Candidatus Omnitrophica bacterium]|nr:stage 0 sporulation family protein [Candidatus Omnitrophota bacterium]
MVEVIQVRMRESGKVVFYNARGIKFNVGEYIVLEADRGIDYGQVVSETELIENAAFDEPLKAVIRRVDNKDKEKIKKNKQKSREAHNICEKKIIEHRLPMKLVDTEYAFDVSKLVFYFTSEGRVDFRDLVKDLAAVFKVRIELRQIGVRDEAKMLGGLGHCGRKLCCGTFLKDFEPVTIKMAKEQNMSLNPTKISGVCGRLMCCLDYEYKTYKDFSAYLPVEGERLKTPEGTVRVRNVNILKKKVMVEFEDGLVKEISFAECSCPEHGCPVHKKITVLKRKKGKG